MISPISGDRQMNTGPKLKGRRHSSYDESADEPPQPIEKEPTEMEKENPADDTGPMQQGSRG